MSFSKTTSIVDRTKDLAMESLVKGILPKVLPMIEPALAKLKDFMGKNISMYCREMNGVIMVVIIDKSKGDFDIHKIKNDEVFSVDEPAIVKALALDEFIQDLLSGKFSI